MSVLKLRYKYQLMRTSYIKLMLAILIFVLSSCEGDYHITYKWVSVSICNADNYGAEPVCNVADSILYKSYVVQISFEAIELSKTGRYLDRETPPYNVNRVVGVNVTSNVDFNPSFPKDSSLNSLFLGYMGYLYKVEPIDSLNWSVTDSKDFKNNPLEPKLDFLLIGKPQSFTGKFYVEFTLNDGTILTDSTDVIKLYE